MQSRRSVLTGLIAAPAIIRPGILMPISKTLMPTTPIVPQLSVLEILEKWAAVLRATEWQRPAYIEERF